MKKFYAVCMVALVTLFGAGLCTSCQNGRDDDDIREMDASTQQTEINRLEEEVRSAKEELKAAAKSGDTARLEEAKTRAKQAGQELDAAKAKLSSSQ